jgi:oligoendopeptidase F
MTTTYQPTKFPRKWLEASASLETWADIEPWYKKLQEWPIDSADDLQAWMHAKDELDAAVGQVGNKRYVAMTLKTDDPACESAYLAFVREIEPNLKPIAQTLRNKYLDSAFRKSLPDGGFQLMDRALENRRSLYREANIPRETQVSELTQQYQKLVGSLTVSWRGQERTPAQMAPLQEETDRAARVEAWLVVALRRLQEKSRFDDLFDSLHRLRVEIGREAGFASFTDYSYRTRERFDYGVPEAEAFQNAVADCVVPLAREIQARRRKQMGLEQLRPWDLAVDPLSRPPLRPFTEESKLISGVGDILGQVDKDLAGQFDYMRQTGLLDLTNRKGKAPGGYQTTFEEDRLPFIFMNAVGLDGDLRTLLHEAGHAFHALACRSVEPAAYRESPMEFCEVASMSMELLGARQLDSFYSPADADRSYRQLLEGIVLILPWIAQVDAFQHAIYRHADPCRNQRRTDWQAMTARFGGDVDWSGLEEIRDHVWHRQLHIFLYPFYYIEYGIAQLGALQVWKSFRHDPSRAVAAYKHALSLGGSRTLPELFAAAGARFDFSAETIRPLMDLIGEELGKIPE